jgi:RNA polymerase subunit RPABC4/transcription elongation factor Spt4
LDGVLDQAGSVVGDVLNSVPVRLVVLGTIAYVTVVWLATTHWVLRDMRRRRNDPLSPYVAALGIVLASPIVLPISAFTYLVLRPRETLAEARERELTERLDALGAGMLLLCPDCRRAVEEDWLTCPACRTRLARRCLGCGRTMGLDWSLCGFCGAEFGRPAVAHRVPATVRRSLPQRRPVAAELPARTAAPARVAAPAARAEDHAGGRERVNADRRRAEGPERKRRERATEPHREVFESGG